MQQSRIAELLEPFLTSANDQRLPLAYPELKEVSNAGLIQNISMYIDILQRWNARINLTAIRNEEEIVTRHFGESLFAARYLFPRTANVGSAALGCPAEQRTSARLADLGSGAGFPGLPIKLWAPEISLTLVESNQKKAAFLREVARALTLTDINVKNARAEDLNPNQTFDLVTLRAVERFSAVLSTAATLVAPMGRLALLIGSSQVNEAQAILPEFSWQPEIPIPSSKARTLLIGTNNHNS
jgi:16S rRNA (guanine527-N7)-methyltransferase